MHSKSVENQPSPSGPTPAWMLPSQSGVSAALAQRLRMRVPSMDLEAGYFLGRARTTNVPGLAEAYRGAAAMMMDLRDRYPLTDEEKAQRELLLTPAERSYAVLEAAFDDFIEDLALAAPETLVHLLERHRALAERAPASQAPFAQAAHGEMIARMEKGLRYVEPMPGEDEDPWAELRAESERLFGAGREGGAPC